MNLNQKGASKLPSQDPHKIWQANIEYSTSMGVSLLSEAATSVSMFIAEPNPALNECYLSMHTDIKHKKKKKKSYIYAAECMI